MCLIGIAYKAHPQFELVLAANRDEFHARPAAAAGWWADAPDVVGGRDLLQGGGWLALSARRRLAAVTNVRRMIPPDPNALSRGKLVADFTRGTVSAGEFLNALRAQAPRYGGFNLLLWDGAELFFATNQAGFEMRALTPGLYGLSNATLDTPWPKLTRLRDGMRQWTAQGDTAHEPLLQLLHNHDPVPDAELPGTGVGLELERMLAPAFIQSRDYGTRASTVVSVGSAQARFTEHRFGPEGQRSGESSIALELV